MKMNIRKFLLFVASMLAGYGAYADDVLSLDSCRALALRNNKELKMAGEKINMAHWNRKSAATNYLPSLAPPQPSR